MEFKKINTQFDAEFSSLYFCEKNLKILNIEKNIFIILKKKIFELS